MPSAIYLQCIGKQQGRQLSVYFHKQVVRIHLSISVGHEVPEKKTNWNDQGFTHHGTESSMTKRASEEGEDTNLEEKGTEDGMFSNRS